jgi:hypothetical protein
VGDTRLATQAGVDRGIPERAVLGTHPVADHKGDVALSPRQRQGCLQASRTRCCPEADRVDGHCRANLA